MAGTRDSSPRRVGFRWHGLVFLGAIAGPSLAQQPQVSSGDSGRVITALATSNQPVDAVQPAATMVPSSAISSGLHLPSFAWDLQRLPKPDQAKEKVQQAAYHLQQYLNPESNPRGADWLKFLRWDELLKEIHSESPSPARLDQFALRMRQNYQGLDYAPFVTLRDAIHQFSRGLRYGSEPEKSIETLQKQLGPLADALQKSPEGSDMERQREIGRLTQFLTESNQAEPLVRKIESIFGGPNVRLLVSDHFLQTKLKRTVSEPSPVQEVILGTRIQGNSITQGSVTPRLVPNGRNATMALQLLAQFESDNRGVNRGVTILTKGHAPISAAETVQLLDHGLVAMNDASVDADLDTDVTGIQHRLKIVRKLAARQVAKKQDLANQIGEQRLETRLRKQFHEQLVAQLSQANERLGTLQIPALNRLGLDKPKRSSWTSKDYLALRWLARQPGQLAAPNACPMVVEPRGVTLQLHQSVLHNLLDPVLAGRIIQNTDLPAFVQQAGGKVSDRLQKESQEEPWSMSMASYHPVEMEFEDGLIQIRIRTTNQKKGDQKLDQPAAITAAYRPVVENNTLQLVREGDVKVELFGARARGLEATTTRAFLQEKFDEVFRNPLLEKPINPFDQLPEGAPDLQLVSVETQDGWLQARVE